MKHMVHGGDIWGAARDLGRELEDILDLSASLNPLGRPSGLDDVIIKALKHLCYYPDRKTLELRRSLAGFLGLEPNNILAGNGSTALIRLMARALDLKNIIVMAPSFGEVSRAMAISGRHFHYHHLREENNFLPDARDVEEAWQEDPSCVIVTNPQTPSGALASPEILDALLAQAIRRQAWLVVDEAFIDFAPRQAGQWAPAKVKEYPKLLVLRSLTKFYCLAGLRLGYLICHEQTQPALLPLGEPWSVNTLAQAAGIYCLQQHEYAESTRKAVNDWRAEMSAELEKLGLKVFPSQVNYLLTRLPQDAPNAAEVAARCAAQGVLVRDCSSFTACSDRHLRLAVTTPEERQKALAVLAEALKP